MKTRNDAGRTTVVRACICAHPGQDRMYGKGFRVMNRGAKEVRCTVCGALRTGTMATGAAGAGTAPAKAKTRSKDRKKSKEKDAGTKRGGAGGRKAA